MTSCLDGGNHRMVIQRGESPDSNGIVPTVCLDCGMEDIGRVRQ